MHYHRHGTRRIPNPALHTLTIHTKLTKLTKLTNLTNLAKPKYIQQKASLR